MNLTRSFAASKALQADTFKGFGKVYLDQTFWESVKYVRKGPMNMEYYFLRSQCFACICLLA